MHADPNSPNATLTKRQQEVLERLEMGQGAKRIATDVGISRNAVYQTIERLRRGGALPETYTPSGQPPRRPADAERSSVTTSSTAPRESALATLRELAGGAGSEDPAYAGAIEGAISGGDAVGLAYELGRLDAGGDRGLPLDLIESALRRLSVLPSQRDKQK